MSSLNDTKTIGTGKRSERSAKDFYQAVCFDLDGIEFGLEVSCVEEIIRPREISKTAGQSSPAARKTSWRGKDLTLTDLRVRLGYPEAEADADTRIIIVSFDGRHFGAIVDSVSELLRLDPGQIDYDPKTETGVETELIKGMYRDDDRSLIILDGARVFDL